jgi:hypothetical protein
VTSLPYISHAYEFAHPESQRTTSTITAMALEGVRRRAKHPEDPASHVLEGQRRRAKHPEDPESHVLEGERRRAKHPEDPAGRRHKTHTRTGFLVEQDVCHNMCIAIFPVLCLFSSYWVCMLLVAYAHMYARCPSSKPTHSAVLGQLPAERFDAYK